MNALKRVTEWPMIIQGVGGRARMSSSAPDSHWLLDFGLDGSVKAFLTDEASFSFAVLHLVDLLMEHHYPQSFSMGSHKYHTVILLECTLLHGGLRCVSPLWTCMVAPEKK